MAADILLHNADMVPVGEINDNTWNYVATLLSFNHQYSETLVIPEPYVPVPYNVSSGSSRKMSKSDKNESATLHILDEPDRIRKKIASVVTDSGSEIKATVEKPGVTNLLTIHSALSGKSIPELEDHFSGKGYGDLKSELTEIISESLSPVRVRYKELIDDKSYLKSVLIEGAGAAQKRAYKILSKVYRKVGFPDREETGWNYNFRGSAVFHHVIPWFEDRRRAGRLPKWPF